jgi:hypothetical protein
MPLHDVMFVASAKLAKRFLADIRRLGLNHPGGSYEYESISGTTMTGTYIGYEGLNLRFRKADGTTFAAPVIDMGDGSLVTEYLTHVGGMTKTQGSAATECSHKTMCKVESEATG